MPVKRIFISILFLYIALNSHAQTSSNRLKSIQKEGTLKVCVQNDYPGIGYISSKTQKREGLDVGMALELAKDLSVKPQFVDSSPGQIVAHLNSHRCDVAMLALTITPELSKQVRFTKPVLVSDVYGITTHFNRRIKSWADIDKPGSVVAVLKGSQHEQLLRQRFSKARIESQESFLISEYEVESGRADLLITDFQNSRRLLAAKDWTRIVTPSDIFNRAVHAYATDLNDESWGEVLDKFVKDIKRDGRLLNMARIYNLDGMVVTR